MKARFDRLLLLALLGVFVLVAVVAIASTGSTPSGSGDTRPPSELLLDTFFSLAVVMLIPGAALLIYALTQRKAISEEIASGRYRRPSAIALIVFVAAITGFVYLVRDHGGFLPYGTFGETVEIGPNGEIVVRDASAYDPDAYVAEFAWIPVAVVVALLGLAVGAYVLAARRREEAAGRGEAEAAEELADVLEETLDDLRADPDSRRAVIAAYARLERAFASAGLARRRQETAEEYVPRVLAALEVDMYAVRALTDLFTVAKFSHHPVTGEMKLEAIAALERIRDDLRVEADRARAARSAPELAEPAATT